MATTIGTLLKWFEADEIFTSLNGYDTTLIHETDGNGQPYVSKKTISHVAQSGL